MMKNTFQMGDNLRYNLRSQNQFLRRSTNASQCVLNSLGVFSTKIWNIVPPDNKNNSTLNIFQEKIRQLGT